MTRPAVRGAAFKLIAALVGLAAVVMFWVGCVGGDSQRADIASPAASAAPTVVVVEPPTPLRVQPRTGVVPIPGPVFPDDPFVDVPRLGVDGIATDRVGTYPFGTAVLPMIDLISEYVAMRPTKVDDTYEWSAAGVPVLQLGVFPSGELRSIDLDLSAMQAADFEAVGLPQRSLMSGPFEAAMFRDDLAVYVGRDDRGLAIRCVADSGCFHQEAVINADGSIGSLGRVMRYRVDIDHRQTWSVTTHVRSINDDRVDIYSESPFSHAGSLDLTDGATVAVVGGPIQTSDGRRWLRITQLCEPHVPTVLIAVAAIVPALAPDPETGSCRPSRASASRAAADRNQLLDTEGEQI